LSESFSKDIFLHEHERWSQFENGEKINRNDLGPEDIAVLDELQEKYNIKYNFNENFELRIESNKYIGSVKLENINHTINIVPKIFEGKNEKYWFNLSILLAFANNIKITKFLDERKNFFTKDEAQNLVNPFHWDLISKCEELMRYGLLKSYVVHAENTSGMRGKLLMQYQMLNDVMRRPKFFCEYDELEFDSTENRLVLQAMTIVERISQNLKVKMNAMYLAQRLSAVVKKEDVGRRERRRMMQSYNRQNDRYKAIHQTCELIIEQQGVGNIYRGDKNIVPIFYDMDNSFELFVGNLFKEYYVNDQGSQCKNCVETQSDEKAWIGEGLTDRHMRPDIIIYEGRKVKEIIDVKYKTHVITTQDLYQIGFYMHEYGKYAPLEHAFAILPKVTGVRKGSYTAKKTGKIVHVKTIDVKECIKMLRDQDRNGLERIVKDLITIKN